MFHDDVEMEFGEAMDMGLNAKEKGKGICKSTSSNFRSTNF